MAVKSVTFAMFACWLVLVHGAPGAKKNVSSSAAKKESSTFGLIMQANQNQGARGFSRDGIELFQGDIVMTPDIKTELKNMGLYPFNNTTPSNNHRRPKRAAMSHKAKRWMGTDGRPLIPYVLESSNSHARRLIEASMRHWTQRVPCLRFVRRTNQRSFLSFYNGGGCFSHVGRSGGRQRVSIARGCEHLSVIVHEIGHALGFWHEQSRPDRDRYVKIYWNNIIPRYKYAFHKYADGRINSLGVPYDYDSVMHYNSRAFGIGNRITITRTDGSTRLGNPKGLSPKDIKQARLLYCGSGGTRPTRPQPPTPRPPIGCKHKDLSTWCSYWSSQGYCSRSSSYYSHMSVNCKKSCLCKSSNCKDKRPSCRAWSNRGYCTTYKPYMDIYCKKSCGLCS